MVPKTAPDRCPTCGSTDLTAVEAARTPTPIMDGLHQARESAARLPSELRDAIRRSGTADTVSRPLPDSPGGQALDAAGYAIVPTAAAAPDRCPTCGSADPDVRGRHTAWLSKPCPDPWHGGTQ